MAGQRILLLPNTNTLSHLAQALAIAEWLEPLGGECHIGLAEPRRAWGGQFFPRCHVVRELWEPSGLPYPCPRWFADADWVEQCLSSQEQLRQQLQPAAVIGIFDFLGKAGARGIPFISINGHCMLPTYRGVLGFDHGDSSARQQQQRTLDSFWRFAARKINPSLERRGLPPVTKANEMLVGDHNLIYEIPELAEDVPVSDAYQFIGPIWWEGWDRIGEAPPAGRRRQPTVVFNTGTLPILTADWMERVVTHLLEAGGRVWMNTGHGGAIHTTEALFARPFLSARRLLPEADLVVCTGGIGACYQHLRYAVPSLIVPTQPEQATNGIQIQKQGCGRLIAPSMAFTGGPREYVDAVDHQLVMSTLEETLLRVKTYRPRLEQLQRTLRAYDARAAISRLIGQLR
ncbi:MAG TPA: hypothetical protein VMV72_01485 [Verrucomicrobiae bacterium]|nr:hypothetical protein [Verrucomicrobiae bacterium]